MADPGRLESVDLREVWKHEAIDFTIWMSRDANLARLSEKIGIKLAVMERESRVGDVSAEPVSYTHLKLQTKMSM